MFTSLVPVAAAAALSLFSSSEPLAFQLKAPFNDLFEHARTDDKYAVSGSLTYTDNGRQVTIDGVKITVRGNTSRRESECTFPKLKVQLPADAGADHGGPFGGVDSVKIGTHCGDAPDEAITNKYGRLPNEHSPVRELFVYKLLKAVGVPTLEARGATITYIYTDPKAGESPAEDQPLVRKALLLEDTDAGVKRFGSREIGEKAFTNARALFTTADTVRLAFAEAMIGNFDWCLKMTADDTYRCDARHPLWNIAAAATADGKARPIMYDFDVSGIVTGHHPWFKDVFDAAFSPDHSAAETEVVAQVQRTRSLFKREDLDAARHEFIARKVDAYNVLEGASLDSGGRKIAQDYLDRFYRAIETDDAFYRPVIVQPNTQVYANADQKVLCPADGPAPPGTPVSAPLQRQGDLVQVIVLDALWHWAPPVKCAAVHEGPVWIDAGAIDRNYPRQ